MTVSSAPVVVEARQRRQQPPGPLLGDPLLDGVEVRCEDLLDRPVSERLAESLPRGLQEHPAVDEVALTLGQLDDAELALARWRLRVPVNPPSDLHQAFERPPLPPARVEVDVHPCLDDLRGDEHHRGALPEQCPDLLQSRVPVARRHIGRKVEEMGQTVASQRLEQLQRDAHAVDDHELALPGARRHRRGELGHRPRLGRAQHDPGRVSGQGWGQFQCPLAVDQGRLGRRHQDDGDAPLREIAEDSAEERPVAGVQRLHLVQDEDGTLHQGVQLLEHPVLIADQGVEDLDERRQHHLGVPGLGQEQALVDLDQVFVGRRTLHCRTARWRTRGRRPLGQRRQVVMGDQDIGRIDAAVHQDVARDIVGLLDQVDERQRVDDARSQPALSLDALTELERRVEDSERLAGASRSGEREQRRVQPVERLAPDALVDRLVELPAERPERPAVAGQGGEIPVDQVCG
ncbi:hypothetical protein HRbin26_01732 [bacterium HR26]|nr:hypothetical protein HRbin26_01732 [bacterium HR26]